MLATKNCTLHPPVVPQEPSALWTDECLNPMTKILEPCVNVTCDPVMAPAVEPRSATGFIANQFP